MLKHARRYVLLLLFITGNIKGQFQTQSVDRCTLAAVGDIMVHDKQIVSARNEKTGTYDFSPCFMYVKDLLSKADITIGNLETTLPGREEDYTGYPRFGAPDALIKALKASGFDLLSTANNHACDKGGRGLIRTLDVLDAYHISHCGTYRDKKEHRANRHIVLNHNNITVSFLNYTYGTNGLRVPKNVIVNQLDSVRAIRDMAVARKAGSDCICVLLHLGTEYRRTPDDTQKNWVNFFLNEGADIILGSHPHVVQPFSLTRLRDKYGNTKPRLVIYSLGNFISNQKRPYTDHGIIFSFTIRKQTAKDQRTVISFENIDYTPIMVYKDKKSLHPTYYVLPAEPWIQHNSQLKLPDSVHRKLLKTRDYYKLHLKSGMKQTREFAGSHDRGKRSSAIY